MYGGRQNRNGGELLPSQVELNKNLDAVYVLSLPAFAWFRAEYPPTIRATTIGKPQAADCPGLRS